MRQLCNESNDICSRVGQPAETTDRYDAQSPCSRGRTSDLKELYDFHLRNGSVATLLASRRKTSRYLLFDAEQRLCGWINKDTGQVRPEGFLYDESLYREYAFSGIHVFSPAVFQLMEVPCWEGKFSIMDFYLATCGQTDYCGYLTEKLELIDIGKPETLARAEEFVKRLG